MNQYMARTWVEVSVALLADQKRRNVQLSNDFISVKSLQDELDEWLGVSKIPSREFLATGQHLLTLSRCRQV
jgi:hypothetical protein